MKKAFTHIALQVKDVQASARFYEDWCGMSVVNRHGSSVWMASPGAEDSMVVALIPGLSRKFNGAANISHIGISVESRNDLMTLVARAKREGRLHWDLQKHDFPVGELFAIRDPDGYIIEFSHGQPLGKDFKDRGKGLNP